jgi:hypothetical protein
MRRTIYENLMNRTPSTTHVSAAPPRRSIASAAARTVGLALCCLAIVAGCSSAPPHFKVKGKVVDGANAVLPDKNTSIHLTFVPEAADGKGFDLYNAMLNSEDGSFEVEGNESIGMPAGKYRVKMRSMAMINPSALSQLINRKFANDPSPIIVDVVDDKTPVVIDIALFKKK